MSSRTNIVGIDVGGANLKFADCYRNANTIPFPLWKQRDQLTSALKAGLQQFSDVGTLAVTMTGELADCYSCPQEGVEDIVQACLNAGQDCLVQFWQTSGEFVDADVAIEFFMLTSAANWLAQATWASRYFAETGNGLLIDFGSTTTDIIPIIEGLPQPTGYTDFERLISGELIYTGGSRTPLCSLANEITFQGQTIGVAAELFATTIDLELILNPSHRIPPDTPTADGRPADSEHAAQRFCRMLCTTPDQFDTEELTELAHLFRYQQQVVFLRRLRQVLSNMPAAPAEVLVSGSHEYLAAQMITNSNLNLRTTSLNELAGPAVTTAACAYALAVLMYERSRLQ